MNWLSIKVKAKALYACTECGSTELIQAHHEIPGEDDSLIALCAECHSERHPDVPKALFFSKRAQPYWHNKSASSLARVFGVHSRTIIRTAKKLEIPPGILNAWDEELIKSNIKKLNRIPKCPIFDRNCGRCNYSWHSHKPSSYYCPRCGYWVGPRFFQVRGFLIKERQPSLFSKGVLFRLKKLSKEKKDQATDVA